MLVDSYPLAYFAQRIGGDLVEVSFPAPPGVDPSFWKPDADTIALYQKADLILINGAGFAAWVDTATLPGSRVVDTSAAIADRLLPLEGAVTHSHGGMGEHSHSGFATRLWLDPTLAAAQATAIASAFAAARPDDKASFDQGLAALRGDLEALDSKLTALASRIGATPLLFSHPVYAYLIRRYGLERPVAPLGAHRGARSLRLGAARREARRPPGEAAGVGGGAGGRDHRRARAPRHRERRVRSAGRGARERRLPVRDEREHGAGSRPRSPRPDRSPSIYFSAAGCQHQRSLTVSPFIGPSTAAHSDAPSRQ